MGLFTDNLPREVRLEYLRPEQVEAEKQKLPVIYVPFGSIEWHGYHNAVGLDAIKTHEQLVGLALRIGGVVYPSIFQGAGGGHTDFPTTFMVRPAPMQQVVEDLLAGFEKRGYTKCLLLSGHYPNPSEYLHNAIKAYKGNGGTMDVMALFEAQVPGVGGDHAAKFETSYMMYLHPRTVDQERLHREPRGVMGKPGEFFQWMTPEHVDNPCYGVCGIDPRLDASADVGRENMERLWDYLARWVRGEAAAVPA